MRGQSIRLVAPKIIPYRAVPRASSLGDLVKSKVAAADVRARGVAGRKPRSRAHDGPALTILELRKAGKL